MLLLAAPRIAGLLSANVPSSLKALEAIAKNPYIPTIEDVDRDIEETLFRCYNLMVDALYPKVITIYPGGVQ